MNEFPVDGGNVKSKVPTGDGEDMSLWVTVEIEGCVSAEGSGHQGPYPCGWWNADAFGVGDTWRWWRALRTMPMGCRGCASRPDAFSSHR